METMLSALNNTENLKIKELTVSAIGAIGENGLRTEMIDGLLSNVSQQSPSFDFVPMLCWLTFI